MGKQFNGRTSKHTAAKKFNAQKKVETFPFFFTNVIHWMVGEGDVLSPRWLYESGLEGGPEGGFVEAGEGATGVGGLELGGRKGVGHAERVLGNC